MIASPARPDDAAAMLRTCLAAAAEDGSVCVFLEPIALYHTRDLHDDGDGGWLAAYPAPGAHVPAGRARSYGDGTDLTMVTFGNGLRMSLRVARRLAVGGIGARVVDLRWLAPLPVDDLLREARLTGRVLVVDETRRTGGVSEGVVTALTDAGYRGPDRAGDQQGQLRPARPGGEHGAAGRTHDREGGRRPPGRALSAQATPGTTTAPSPPACAPPATCLPAGRSSCPAGKTAQPGPGSSELIRPGSRRGRPAT